MKGNVLDDNEVKIVKRPHKINEEVSVQEFLDYAKINNVNVSELSDEESEHIMNEIKLNKRKLQIKEFVAINHIKKDGLPRAITPPSKPGGLWYTSDPRDLTRKIRAKDEDTLYEKLYAIYTKAQHDLYSIEAWYDIGVQFRKRNTNPQRSTIVRHETTKRNYFTQELLDCDVREVTSSYLRSFISKAVEEHGMSLAEVKQLKGTLNLVFDAAADPEIGCRNNNPLLTIKPASFF